MEEKPNDPIPIDNGDSEGTRTLRDMPPAHYAVKINSYSGISKFLIDAQLPNYESEAFTVGGYKWKLVLYLNGDKERNGKGYVSLHLAIAEKDQLPLGWEVNVTFKFFVYDQILDKYLTIQDSKGMIRRFHEMKSVYGFAKLLPLATFKDAANGYLVNDKCVFGAEVFFMSYSGRVQSVTPRNGCYTWKITKFSHDRHHEYSKTFTIGNQQWRLWLYPKGYCCLAKGSPAIYLEAVGIKSLPKKKIYANLELAIVNQRNGEEKKKRRRGFCFSESNHWAGFSSLLSQSDLDIASFDDKTNLIVQAKVDFLSTDQNFSLESDGSPSGGVRTLAATNELQPTQRLPIFLMAVAVATIIQVFAIKIIKG